MKKSLVLLFFLSALSWCGLNLPENNILGAQTLAVTGRLDDNVTQVFINNQDFPLRDSRDIKFQLFFNRTGKNILVLKNVFNNGSSNEQKYKFLVLKKFSDAPLNSIFSELAALDLCSGYTDNTVRPRQFILKQEALDLIAKTLGITGRNQEQALVQRGLLNKAEAGSTAVKLTRAEAITLLCRMEQLKLQNLDTKSRFVDVGEKKWYFPYVQAAESRGWLSIFKDKFLLPEANITREEFFQIFANTYLIKEKLDTLRDWSKGYDQSAAQPKVIQRELISLSFENMDIQKVTSLIARQANINIVMGPDVQGKVSGHFKEVYPEIALSNILRSLGYTYVLDGNLYRVERIRTTGAGRKTNTRVREFKINYADINNVVKEIVKMIPSLQDRIIVAKETNSVLISERHPELRLASEIISNLDVPPLQVMVEAKIFEVSAEESSRLGSKIIGLDHEDSNITTFESSNLEPVPLADNRAIFVRSVDKDFKAYISTLETRADVNMLSSPKVIVVNNKEAVLETLDEVAYVDETITYTTSGQTVSKKVIFKNVGTKLKFIPHINDKGKISIDLYPEISSSILDAATSYPLTHLTKAHTQVVVEDGETFLLGGLLRDKTEKIEKKVPLLGDIPLLGLLFRRTEDSVVKKDVIIMITPTILDPYAVSKEINPLKK